MVKKVVFLKATDGGVQQWKVPDDFSPLNTIHCIGGGGGGGGPPFDDRGGGGGGGGAYSRKSNVTLTPGLSVFYRVGPAGSGGVSGSEDGKAGGDTWFGASSYNNALCAARGGTGGRRVTPGTGGQASQGIGDFRTSGGDGGAGGGSDNDGGGGGGGAGGPHGNGGTGGNVGNTAPGGGGGGANGGSNGVSAGSGSNGGNNRFGTGGGARDQEGTNGGGGGGGSAVNPGRSGSMDVIWTQTSNGEQAGPGSGAGGAGRTARGGDAGNYGGGGGGGGEPGGFGGNGAPGIIVIEYEAAEHNTRAWIVG